MARRHIVLLLKQLPQSTVNYYQHSHAQIATKFDVVRARAVKYATQMNARVFMHSHACACCNCSMRVVNIVINLSHVEYELHYRARIPDALSLIAFVFAAHQHSCAFQHYLSFVRYSRRIGFRFPHIAQYARTRICTHRHKAP